MIKNIIKNRRSISSFTGKKVPLELIDELISVSGYAPSSCNTQPWFFLVFHTKKSKEKLNSYIQKGYEYTNQSLKKEHKIMGSIYARLLSFFSNYGKFDEAPAYILVFARPYNAPLFSQAIKFAKNKQIEKIADDSVKTSSAMAMQNFLLIAHEKGLGTRVKDGIKFLMNFDKLKNEFYKEFKIPLTYQLISGIQLGYPAKKALERKAHPRISLKKARKFV
ncbi:nitroreductase family protein [Candidatus Pacearchaeota archaeon]|nr:nitroreductase family protein [Candidatus Pacearchaeota archaeon]